MNISKLLFLIPLSLVISCDSKINDFIGYDGPFADDQKFDVVDLHLKPCLVDTIPLCPYSCCFLDSLFVVCEFPGKVADNIFKIYHNDSLLAGFGSSGNGPRDFQFPMMSSAGKSENGCFYVNQKQYFSEISLGAADFAAEIKNYDLPLDLLLPNNVLCYNDDFIVVSKTSDYQLMCYNRKTNHVDGFNYFENGIWSGIPDFSLAMELFPSVSTSNGQYAVLAYQYQNMIDIISLSDLSLHKRICFSNFDCNTYTVDDGDIVFDDEDCRFFYSSLSAGESSFYALCWDCLESEESAIPKIYQFDYDGNVIKQFNLDIAVKSFAVKDSMIGAIAFEPNQGELILCKGFLN